MLKQIAEDISLRLSKKSKPDHSEEMEEDSSDNGGMSKQDIAKYKEMLKRLNTLGH
jgi:hypothetical protein